MIFATLREKYAQLPKRRLDDLWMVAVVVLVAVTAFGIGRASVLYGEKGSFEIVYPNQQASVGAATVAEGEYVASKTGSKYHLPWCAGAASIKPENKVYFKTKEDAEAAGYEPASNCKGI